MCFCVFFFICTSASNNQKREITQTNYTIGKSKKAKLKYSNRITSFSACNLYIHIEFQLLYYSPTINTRLFLFSICT